MTSSENRVPSSAGQQTRLVGAAIPLLVLRQHPLASLQRADFAGVVGASGSAEVILPAEELAEFEAGADGLLAAALRYRDDPQPGDLPLTLAVACSPIVEVLRADG